MKVTLFCRNVLGGFSIENMTANLAQNLPDGVSASIFKPRSTNKGFWNKLTSIFEAQAHQSEVNHVTGDTHFLTYLLDRRRTILTIWDCARLMNDEFGVVQKSLFKFFWFSLPQARCRYITTVSEETRRNLARYAGIKEDQVIVIPTGVDQRFTPLDLSGEQKQELLKNPGAKKTVLHVSVAMPNKNVARLIEALKGLDVKFVKVGTFMPAEMRLLEDAGIDYVHFIDPNKELLARIYNAADCLVFPSLIEGFGMPVVEAQKCGCPVVTSCISSLPEVAGDGAVFVDPYSIISIREGIQKVLGDARLWDAMRQKGFSNAQRFEWKAVAAAYCEVYKKVAEALPSRF